jgi:hypothetical protein
MSARSKTRPVISLHVVTGDVPRSWDGAVPRLNIGFRCAFAPGKTGLRGSAITLSRKEMYSVVQLAEHAYREICKQLVQAEKFAKALKSKRPG